MDYPKNVPGVGLVNGKFVDDNPLTGTPGSLIPAEWGNAVTDEVLSVILSTNAVPDENNSTQLKDAIVSIADLRVSKSVVPASESVSGVAKIATQAQTNSGVDDTTIVTPKKMAGAVQGQALVAFTTGGTAPLFTLAPVPAISAYAVNQRFQVKFHSGGAGSDKMNISGLGPKSIMQYDASGNKVAAVIQGQLTDAVYDGTDIVLLDQLPNASGVTPPQFDNSTKLPTTAFVQGVGFQFSGAFGVNTSTVLTAAAHAGGLVVGTSATLINVTLPLASTMPAKTVIKFWSFGGGGMSIVTTGSDGILLPAATTALPLPTGAWVTLASNGVAGWYAIEMSGIGVGQTRQVFAVGTTRVAGTTYYNTTGRPILIFVYNTSTNAIGGAGTLTVGGVSMNFPWGWYSTPTSAGGGITAIVLPGESYVASSAVTWNEIR
ncbi:hypothetical protein [Pseudomonas sp. MWU12-2037]|uniref:hypothetical protein n=1 Tax=Pseudomonas sp. MWU12-2037 TaxID=2928690 RepID=UPI00200EB30E|nr:hypothetical protein [Pseudomonas sp. MWU12-2037]